MAEQGGDDRGRGRRRLRCAQAMAAGSRAVVRGRPRIDGARATRAAPRGSCARGGGRRSAEEGSARAALEKGAREERRLGTRRLAAAHRKGARGPARAQGREARAGGGSGGGTQQRRGPAADPAAQRLGPASGAPRRGAGRRLQRKGVEGGRRGGAAFADRRWWLTGVSPEARRRREVQGP